MSKIEFGQEIHGTVLAVGNELPGADEPLRFVTVRLDDGQQMEAYISERVALLPGQSFQAKAGHTVYRPSGKVGEGGAHIPELLGVTIKPESPKQAPERKWKYPALVRLFARCTS